jgi:hypothetical protein
MKREEWMRLGTVEEGNEIEVVVFFMLHSAFQTLAFSSY